MNTVILHSYKFYLTSTFSTTCFPKEQTLVEHVIVIFSFDSYLSIKIINFIYKLMIQTFLNVDDKHRSFLAVEVHR